MLAHGCAQPVSCSWTGETRLCAGFQGSSPEQAQREGLDEGGRNWLGLGGQTVAMTVGWALHPRGSSGSCSQIPVVLWQAPTHPRAGGG